LISFEQADSNEGGILWKSAHFAPTRQAVIPHIAPAHACDNQIVSL